MANVHGREIILRPWRPYVRGLLAIAAALVTRLRLLYYWYFLTFFRLSTVETFCCTSSGSVGSIQHGWPWYITPASAVRPRHTQLGLTMVPVIFAWPNPACSLWLRQILSRFRLLLLLYGMICRLVSHLHHRSRFSDSASRHFCYCTRIMTLSF